MAQQSLNLPYMLLTGIVLVLIILIPTLYRPLLLEIQQAREEIVTTRQRVQERQAFLKTIDKKTAELQSLAREEQELAVMLPVNESFADVLRLIHQTATTAQVSVETVSNISDSVTAHQQALQNRDQPTELPDMIMPLGVQIKASGTYQQIRTWLDELEKSPRIMDVLTISLNRNEQQPEVLGGDFVIHFYHYKPPVE